jgi:undecaprenyl-phosphate 4-deoxy-4-formamido-L-arabinose transferase
VISALIPVYRGERTIEDLVQRLSQALQATGDQWEILLINDASPDNSWAKIEELARHLPQVRGLDLMRNYGQHNALLCGLRAARGDIVVTLDDDLQHAPEEIPALLARLAEGFDVVYGAPRRTRQAPWRRAGSWLTRRILSHAMGVEAASNVSAFRVFRTRVRDAFAAFDGPNVNLDVLLTWGASRFAVVRVEHHAREGSESTYTVRKLIRHASNMITGFTVLPLQFASVLGFILTAVGALLLVYIILVYLVSGRQVPGFYFLASVIVLFGGAQLFALGIIGEYLARIHSHAMRRNTYSIRRETGEAKSAGANLA